MENREFPEAADQVCEVLLHRNYFSSKDSAIARKYDVTRLAGFEPHDNIQDQVRALYSMYPEEEGKTIELSAIIIATRIYAMLENELAYYQKNLETWLKRYPGKFVLIKEEELVGVFDTNEEALSAGASRFGLASYLIRRIEKSQEDIKLPALTLGLLYANPAHTTYGTRSDS